MNRRVAPLILEGFDFAPCLGLAVKNSLLNGEDHDGLKHQLPPPPSNPDCSAGSALESPAPPAPPPAKPKPANPNRRHQRRAEERRRFVETDGHRPSPTLRSKHTTRAQPIQTSVEAKEFPVAAGAYTSTKGSIASPEKEDSVQALVEAGFKLIAWDATTSRPIADKNRRVVAVLVSKPKDPGYADACKRVEKLMGHEGAAAPFTKKDTVHKRGRFPALNIGITHGQGGDTPVNLRSEHISLIERLLQDPDFQRVASFADGAFSSWGEKLYSHYSERLSRLWERYPKLRRNFKRSIYPTAAFNFGPRVRTYLHRDHLNCPYGWCAVQSFGNFDPKHGGHLILWELKLVVEFPPHSLILLPSAAITHSNLSVKPSETRFSFTQYCPGALLRFVDNGMMTDKDLRLKDRERYDRRMLERENRWSECIELLPTLDELGIL